MKCLSLREPWIWAILNLNKNVENRNWKLSDEDIGKYIALHSSVLNKSYLFEETIKLDRFYEKTFKIPNIRNTIDKNSLIHGYIICLGKVEKIITSNKNGKYPWFEGKYGIVFSEIVKLKNPIRHRGTLMPHVLDEVTYQEIIKNIPNGIII